MTTRAQRRHPATATPPLTDPVRISQTPTTEAERYALERVCRAAAAKAMPGASRRIRALHATRLYLDAIAESKRRVREPTSQPQMVQAPTGVPTPAAPRGMTQRDSGLYVPGGSA